MRRLSTTLLALVVLTGAAVPTAAQPVTGAAGGGVLAQQAVLAFPVTTSSDAARAALLNGLYALDMQRPIDARAEFERATELDPNFALAHLYLANTSNSLAEFVANLEAAEAAAATASRDEQLMVKMVRRGFDRDVEGALSAAKELTTTAPRSPRVWLALAGVQAGMNQFEEARTSIKKAIELAPEMAVAHMDAGNAYLFGEPRDLDRALRHMQRAAELAPDEPMPYDYLGDVYRAQGKLEDARDAYSEAAKRSPDDGSPYQQRAHVNTFLGDYDAARADYDHAIEMARENQRPSYSVYRALVSAHAGQPAEAIAELEQLAGDIDGMNVPEPTGLKIFALGTAADIALHTGTTDEAADLIARWSTLMREQAESVGTNEFRRNQEAQIEALEARLAIKRGDFAAVEEHTQRMERLVEPSNDPRKMEPVHAVLGEAALAEGDPAGAVEHLRQADLVNDIYVKYLLAQALEAGGEKDEAHQLYADIATWYFNDPDVALTRHDAMAKAGM